MAGSLDFHRTSSVIGAPEPSENAAFATKSSYGIPIGLETGPAGSISMPVNVLTRHCHGLRGKIARPRLSRRDRHGTARGDTRNHAARSAGVADGYDTGITAAPVHKVADVLPLAVGEDTFHGEFLRTAPEGNETAVVGLISIDSNVAAVAETSTKLEAFVSPLISYAAFMIESPCLIAVATPFEAA